MRACLHAHEDLSSGWHRHTACWSLLPRCQDAFKSCSSAEQVVCVAQLPQEVHVCPLERCEAAGVLARGTKPVCNNIQIS